MNDRDSITKVTIFYDPDGDVYAFSENKDLVTLFEGTRLLRGFTKKKLTMNELQYRSFLAFHNTNMLFLNVLTDGDKSFDFVTTYKENSLLDAECDRIYDKILELERILLPLPLADKFRKHFAGIVSARNADPTTMGKFNTFEIFVKLFKESIL